MSFDDLVMLSRLAEEAAEGDEIDMRAFRRAMTPGVALQLLALVRDLTPVRSPS